jgi:hypothetical protein
LKGKEFGEKWQNLSLNIFPSIGFEEQIYEEYISRENKCNSGIIYRIKGLIL